MSYSEESLRTFAGRLATFEGPQQIAKRRASSTKKKQAQTASWPLDNPAPEDLAKAGFYYKPTGNSLDNVVCFLCNKSLDGWEEGDNPISEHLRNVPGCGWAINTSIERRSQDENREEMNPMDEHMVEARRATFQELWPHDSKKGWKCKTQKMVDAGWCYNPQPEADDCVQCFYCGVSLDGWEPKDDPWEEHQRRAPQCDFFSLLEEVAKVAPKSQSKGKKARGSKVSKASRLSTQSNTTAVSEMPSLASLDDMQAEEGDTVMTTASTTSKAKGSRKRAAPKKTTAKRPRANTRSKKTEPANEDANPEIEDRVVDENEIVEEKVSEPELKPKRGRQPKKETSAKVQNVEEPEPTFEESVIQPAKKRTTRTRMPKKQAGTDDEGSQIQAEIDTQAPMISVQPQSKPKRGRKRASDATEKLESSAVIVDDDGEEKTAPQPRTQAKKGRTTRKASNQVQSAIARIEDQIQTAGSPAPEEAKPKAKTKKAKKAPGHEVKASQEPLPEPTFEPNEVVIEETAPKAVSKRISKPPRIPSPKLDSKPEPLVDTDDIYSEVKEPEPTPVRALQKPLPKSRKVQPKSSPPQASAMQPKIDPNPKKVNTELQIAQAPPSPSESQQSSNAENQPPSSHLSRQKSSSFQTQETHVTQQDNPTPRSPLADRTPVHTPSKTMAHVSNGLISTEPWSAIDLEEALLPSPSSRNDSDGEKTGMDVKSMLNTISSPEKQMTVEEWIMWNASKAEEKLRKGCEGMIGRFEREGVRALNSIRGIE